MCEFLAESEVPWLAGQPRTGDADLSPVAVPVAGVTVVRFDQLGLRHGRYAESYAIEV